MASTADYWVGTTIAEGSFGTVVYGKHKLSLLPVAIKCISKAVMAKHPLTAIQVVNEQKILKRLNEYRQQQDQRQQQQQHEEAQHPTSSESSDNSNNENTTTSSTSCSAVSSSSSFPFVKLYASFHDAHCVYLVTELCSGGTLQDVIATSQQQQEAVVSGRDIGGDSSSGTVLTSHKKHDNTSSTGWREHYGLQILQALSVLHNVPPAGILHGDLKPHNLLVTETGRVKLVDFGSSSAMIVLSRNNDDDHDDNDDNDGCSARPAKACPVPQRPSVPQPRGSPGYAAPELMKLATSSSSSLLDVDAITVAADLWSLGCVLFALWTGASPFEDSGSEALTVRRSQEYAALTEEAARMDFLFQEDEQDQDHDDPAVRAQADKETCIKASNRRGPIPLAWKMLIASLLRPTPSERAGMSDPNSRTKDGKLYPSLHELDIWKDVDTTKAPGLLPRLPQWYKEQRSSERQPGEGLKDGAAGWSAFLVE